MNPSSTPGSRWIAIEAIEGAGKTTQIELLHRRLAAEGAPVRVTREPGGTPLGERVRALLLDASLDAMTAEAELFLMFAARAEHWRTVIEPALNRGEWVITDRWVDSSRAYQGIARGLGGERVDALEHWLVGERRPDLVLLLDVPPEVGMARVVARGKRDRFEQEALTFFERARQGYLEQARAHPGRYRVIDANAPLEVVAERIEQAWNDHWGLPELSVDAPVRHPPAESLS